MTFKNIIDMALYRIDVEVASPETESLAVIKNGINQAYMIIASTADQRTTDTTLTYAEKIILPTDLVSIVNLKHITTGDLSEVDYYTIADLLYIKSKDAQSGTLTLTYVKSPAALVNDTDVINLKDIYAYALTSYAAYMYQLFRKKYSAAQLLLQEFNSMIGGKTNES